MFKLKRPAKVGAVLALLASFAVGTALPANAVEWAPAEVYMPADFAGGPQLRDGDCTVWSYTSGVLRWDIPFGAKEAGAKLLLTYKDYDDGGEWKSKSFDPYDQYLEGLTTPKGKSDYYLQWVVNGKKSESSKVTFDRGSRLSWCESTFTNARELPQLPVTDAIKNVQRVGDNVEITFDKKQYEAPNRFIINADGGVYYAETYLGRAYYSKGVRDNNDGTVTVSVYIGPKVNAVAVYLSDGSPGKTPTRKQVVHAAAVNLP